MTLSPHATLRAALLLLLTTLALAGCTEQIEVANAAAQIVSVDEIAALPTQEVSVTYDITDEEGDDQQLSMEVCEADGSACGLPFQGKYSDGVTFVPTAPARSIQTHKFTWDAGCGRVVEGQLVETQLETSYIFRLGILKRPETIQESTPFTLSELGLMALPDCPTS